MQGLHRIDWKKVRNGAAERLFPAELLKENETTARYNRSAFFCVMVLGLVFSVLSFILHLTLGTLPPRGGCVAMVVFFFITLDVYVTEKEAVRAHARQAVYILFALLFVLCAAVYDTGDATEYPNALLPLLFAILLPLIADAAGRIFCLLAGALALHLVLLFLFHSGAVLAMDLILTAVAAAGAAITVLLRTNALARSMRIKSNATHDPLTGLYNRSAINMIGAMVKKGQSGAFIMIDFDNFKHVNDVLGHQMGDQALKSLADVLREVFVPGQTGDIVFRLGGDEFAVYAVDMQDMHTVQDKLREVEERMNRVCLDPSMPSLSVSMGCIVNLGSWRSYESLYTAADQLLYSVKQHGKGTWQISDRSWKDAIRV